MASRITTVLITNRISAGLLGALLTIGVSLGGCGTHGATTTRSRTSSSRVTATHQASRPPIRTSVKIVRVGRLSAAVQDAAAAPLEGGRIVLLGGIDAADTSTDAITLLSGGRATAGGTLPTPQHDAQAARLGHDVYVFGGGEFSSFDHILRYDPTSDVVSTAGRLPTAASDVAVASLKNTAYIVGGFDGSNWLDSILAWRPSTGPRLVGRLPFGLRYAAVAAVDGRLLIVGGITPSRLSDAILSFDPVTGKVTQIGRLPVPLTHASGAAFAGRMLVIGGRRSADGAQTAAILEINPQSGAVKRIGRLPQPLSDAAVTPSSSKLIVAGGETASGPQRTIMALTPRLPPNGP
jgi:hypothetical protein